MCDARCRFRLCKIQLFTLGPTGWRAEIARCMQIPGFWFCQPARGQSRLDANVIKLFLFHLFGYGRPGTAFPGIGSTVLDVGVGRRGKSISQILLGKVRLGGFGVLLEKWWRDEYIFRCRSKSCSIALKFTLLHNQTGLIRGTANVWLSVHW